MNREKKVGLRDFTKKIVVIFAVFCLLLSNCEIIFAYEFPHEFWAMNEQYVQALESGNHSGIIEYGNRIINLMVHEPECQEKRDVLISRYNSVGTSYAVMGDYANAKQMFQLLYEYVRPYGDEYYDYMRPAKERVMQYQSDIRLYTPGGVSPFYGAVNERGNGVLFGICSDGLTDALLENESMVLTYHELGLPLIEHCVAVVRRASETGRAVEFALNCDHEGDDIRNIANLEPYLKEVSDLFAQYPDVPIYLRFAAEFDIWANKAEPEEFVFAFRYVSDYFKQRHSNVALVWSPNYEEGWGVDPDAYYPGDEYVDWVGMSLYAQKYYQGNPNETETNEIIYKTGINSDPVIAAREIIEKYGDRKPIMISESGCGHRIEGIHENMTDFAIRRLREYYSYLPMVYPQIKLIAYFDKFIDTGVNNPDTDYSLSENHKLQKEFLKLVKGKRFAQNRYDDNVDLCYRQVGNGTQLCKTFEVSCYAHLYNANVTEVTYYLDDACVGSSKQIPYTAVIEAENYLGQHRLTAVASFDNGETLVSESDVTITADEGIIYYEEEDSFPIHYVIIAAVVLAVIWFLIKIW